MLNERHFWLPLQIAVFCILLIIGCWTALAFEIARWERNALDQGRRDVTNIAMGFREHVRRLIGAIDQMMITIADQNRDADDYHLPSWVNNSPLLKGMGLQVSIVGPDGLLRISNLGPTGRVDLSDRPHIRHHLDPDASQPYISVPVLGRVSGKWSIQITRRMTRTDGSFAGVLVVSVDPFYFTQFFQSLDLGHDGAIVLAGLDGIVRARGVAGNTTVGQDLSGTTFIQRVKVIDSGYYIASARIDGIERLYAFSRIPDYQLAIGVGSSTHELLASTHRDRIGGIVVGAVITMIVIALGVLLIRDVNRRRDRSDQLIREQKDNLDAAVSNISKGLTLWDCDGELVLCNSRFADMYSLSPDEVRPGLSFSHLLSLRKEIGIVSEDVEQYAQEMREHMAAGRRQSQILNLSDGRIVQIINNPIPGRGWVATYEDITERRWIEHLSKHDSLTNLPNRRHFRDIVIERFGKRGRHGQLAILCLDLDRFKSVNDTLGHPSGDLLLRQVGERAQRCLREGDVIARLGGDEFAILQDNIASPSDTTALMRRLIETMARPFDLNGQQAVIGVSIGVAMAPADGEDVDALIKNADMALYRAKTDGKGVYRFFEPDMDARMQDRRMLELDLRKAIAQGEFEVHYQPLVNLDREQLTGFEALIRWNHPQRGLVSPEEFIPLAEETALIIPIGEWVLRQACMEAARWPQEITVSVNISAVQFRGGQFCETVISALAQSRLAAHRLELEVTESVLLVNIEKAAETLHKLRSFGVKICMDDFGTGYSSLSYLRSFPFDKIKIDPSFVRGVNSNPEAKAIVRAVSGLGASLKMVTTGEGVETAEELSYVREAGCTEAQGFYFSEPVPAARVPELLGKRLRVAAA